MNLECSFSGFGDLSGRFWVDEVGELLLFDEDKLERFLKLDKIIHKSSMVFLATNSLEKEDGRLVSNEF